MRKTMQSVLILSMLLAVAGPSWAIPGGPKLPRGKKGLVRLNPQKSPNLVKVEQKILRQSARPLTTKTVPQLPKGQVPTVARASQSFGKRVPLSKALEASEPVPTQKPASAVLNKDLYAYYENKNLPEHSLIPHPRENTQAFVALRNLLEQDIHRKLPAEQKEAFINLIRSNPNFVAYCGQNSISTDFDQRLNVIEAFFPGERPRIPSYHGYPDEDDILIATGGSAVFVQDPANKARLMWNFAMRMGIVQMVWPDMLKGTRWANYDVITGEFNYIKSMTLEERSSYEGLKRFYTNVDRRWHELVPNPDHQAPEFMVLRDLLEQVYDGTLPEEQKQDFINLVKTTTSEAYFRGSWSSYTYSQSILSIRRPYLPSGKKQHPVIANVEGRMDLELAAEVGVVQLVWPEKLAGNPIADYDIFTGDYTKPDTRYPDTFIPGDVFRKNEKARRKLFHFVFNERKFPSINNHPEEFVILRDLLEQERAGLLISNQTGVLRDLGYELVDDLPQYIAQATAAVPHLPSSKQYPSVEEIKKATPAEQQEWELAAKVRLFQAEFPKKLQGTALENYNVFQ